MLTADKENGSRFGRNEKYDIIILMQIKRDMEECMMKNRFTIVLALLLAALLTMAAHAEEVVIVIPDAAGSAVSTEDGISVDGLMELTFGEKSVVDQFGNIPGDSRNKCLVLPLEILNTSRNDLVVSDAVKAVLSYEDYSFEVSEVSTADTPVSIVGTWTVNEIILDKQQLNVFDITINAVSEDGRVSMIWGGYQPKDPRWYPEQQYFVLDSDQKFKYANGVLGGGGGNFRSVLFRKDAAPVIDTDSLSVLESGTYNYVFKVPNLVAEHLSDCELTLTIDGAEYTFGF